MALSKILVRLFDFQRRQITDPQMSLNNNQYLKALDNSVEDSKWKLSEE